MMYGLVITLKTFALTSICKWKEKNKKQIFIAAKKSILDQVLDQENYC